PTVDVVERVAHAGVWLIKTTALLVPMLVGVNLTVKIQDAPAARTGGQPDREKSAALSPMTVAVIVTATAHEFVTVMACELPIGPSCCCGNSSDGVDATMGATRALMGLTDR